MENIRSNTPINQSDCTTEIRRLCRAAVHHYGGIRKFANEIGEDEDKWGARLNDGRVVGFDVSWAMQVLRVTGDHRILVPFFMHNGKVDIDLLERLCKALNYVVFPLDKNGREEGSSTGVVIDNFLKGAQKLLRYSRLNRQGEI